ncbi:MAG TPA: hypothetical protein VGK94_06060 [Candidatus Polarisedimenticolia bacterium]|jgi:Tfp pilus assembly protein PilN
MMKPPAINLSRRPFRNNTVYYAVFGSCFALLAAASGYNAYDFARTGTDITRLEQELVTRTARYGELGAEVEKMKGDVARIDLTTLNSKSNFANGLILSRLFSWSSLFDRLEDLTPSEVKIRSIRPTISPKGIDIQVDGLARAPDALYEFEKELDASGYFTGVYPLSESNRETKTELNFNLLMNYIPAGRAGAASESPATPTAGIPQPESPAEQGAQAAGGETPAAAAPPAEASQAPAEAPASQGPAAGTANPPSSAEGGDRAAGEMAHAPAPPASHTGRSPREMTNKEMIDSLGQERFVRMRGKFTAKSGPEAGLTNDEYIRKHGFEAFLRARGALDWAAQNPPARPARASAPSGGKP